MSAIAFLLAAAVLGDRCAGALPELRSAETALDAGRWDEGERLLEPLSATHPECSRVVLGQARVRAARGDAPEAERLFARATTLAPDDPDVQASFAQYWLGRRRLPQADYLSSLALSLNPDCPRALVVQGQILGSKGAVPQARGALEKAVALEPGNAEAHYQLGILFFRGNLHPDAVRHFERVTNLRALDARAHDYLAVSLEAMGDAEGADLAYGRALAVNEGPFFDARLDYNYGRFLLKQGRLEESRSHLDRAVSLLPDSRGAHYERGKLRLALKDYAAARQDTERALTLPDPEGAVLDLQVYYLLATIYAHLGESALARKYADLSRTTPIPEQLHDRRR